jgi:hypothetical protein
MVYRGLVQVELLKLLMIIFIPATDRQIALLKDSIEADIKFDWSHKTKHVQMLLDDSTTNRDMYQSILQNNTQTDSFDHHLKFGYHIEIGSTPAAIFA